MHSKTSTTLDRNTVKLGLLDEYLIKQKNKISNNEKENLSASLIIPHAEGPQGSNSRTPGRFRVGAYDDYKQLREIGGCQDSTRMFNQSLTYNTNRNKQHPSHPCVYPLTQNALKHPNLISKQATISGSNNTSSNKRQSYLNLYLQRRGDSKHDNLSDNFKQYESKLERIREIKGRGGYSKDIVDIKNVTNKQNPYYLSNFSSFNNKTTNPKTPTMPISSKQLCARNSQKFSCNIGVINNIESDLPTNHNNQLAIIRNRYRNPSSSINKQSHLNVSASSNMHLNTRKDFNSNINDNKDRDIIMNKSGIFNRTKDVFDTIYNKNMGKNLDGSQIGISNRSKSQLNVQVEHINSRDRRKQILQISNKHKNNTHNSISSRAGHHSPPRLSNAKDTPIKGTSKIQTPIPVYKKDTQNYLQSKTNIYEIQSEKEKQRQRQIQYIRNRERQKFNHINNGSISTNKYAEPSRRASNIKHHSFSQEKLKQTQRQTRRQIENGKEREIQRERYREKQKEMEMERQRQREKNKQKQRQRQLQSQRKRQAQLQIYKKRQRQQQLMMQRQRYPSTKETEALNITISSKPVIQKYQPTKYPQYSINDKDIYSKLAQYQKFYKQKHSNCQSYAGIQLRLLEEQESRQGDTIRYDSYGKSQRELQDNKVSVDLFSNIAQIKQLEKSNMQYYMKRDNKQVQQEQSYYQPQLSCNPYKTVQTNRQSAAGNLSMAYTSKLQQLQSDRARLLSKSKPQQALKPNIQFSAQKQILKNYDISNITPSSYRIQQKFEIKYDSRGKQEDSLYLRHNTLGSYHRALVEGGREKEREGDIKDFGSYGTNDKNREQSKSTNMYIQNAQQTSKQQNIYNSQKQNHNQRQKRLQEYETRLRSQHLISQTQSNQNKRLCLSVVNENNQGRREEYNINTRLAKYQPCNRSKNYETNLYQANTPKISSNMFEHPSQSNCMNRISQLTARINNKMNEMKSNPHYNY